MRHRVIAIVVGLAVATAATGCGATQIDPRKAEQKIAREYEKQVEGAKVESVTCPDTIDAAVGTKATCTLTLEDGRSGRIDLTIIDDEGHLRWKVATPAP